MNEVFQSDLILLQHIEIPTDNQSFILAWIFGNSTTLINIIPKFANCFLTKGLMIILIIITIL